MNNSELYDINFYKTLIDEGLYNDNLKVGELLCKYFPDCKSFLEIGCGYGGVSDALLHGGKDILCIDASEHATYFMKPEVKQFFKLIDITRPNIDLGVHEIVLAFEVVEHIDPNDEDKMLDFMCKHVSKWLIFTPAYPGAGGVHHVNCQWRGYWVEKIQSLGFKVNEELFSRWNKDLENKVRWYYYGTIIFAEKL